VKDDEVGDGKKYVEVIDEELMSEEEKLIEKKINKKIIIDGWRKENKVENDDLKDEDVEKRDESEKFNEDIINIESKKMR
jgi:chaperonin GroEL (HSP60 family)